MTALHRSGCRCSGLDRVCDNRRRAYRLLDAGLSSPDPAVRALSQAAQANLMAGSREAEQCLAAVVRASEGMTLGEAIQASAVMTVEEFARQKAAVRQRWAAVAGSRS